LLQLAQCQAEAAERGDIDGVLGLMPDRARALAGAAPATMADHGAIREVLRLDRDLATVIRQRMIGIRNEARGLQHGRSALQGYRPPAGERRPRRLNALG